MTKSTQDTVLTKNHGEASNTYYLFIFGLSIYAVLGWIGIFILPLSDSTKTILLAMDSLFSLIFLYDFLRNLFTVPNKRRYMKWGWADLLSSIPGLQILRILRLVSIIRIQQILKRTSGRKIWRVYRERRGESALLSSFFALITLLLFGSILVLNAESQAVNGNIADADDAVWWSMVTMTTVGYGDRFPVTSTGRIVGLVLMTSGVAVVGVLTGYLTNFFAGSTKKQDKRLDEISKELTEIRRLLQDEKQQNGGGKAINSH